MRHSNLISGLLASLALFAAGSAQLSAQTIYRIVGPDGKLTFSDKAPADLGKATAATGAGKPLSVGAEPGLPYELRQVIARYPVTLYAGTSCVPCNAGRQLLQARGVPFTEYAVSSSEDVEALQRLSGDNSLPLLTVGAQKIKGFSDAEWGQFLTAANYPTKSMLPPTYRNPAAKPLVAVQRPPQNPPEAAAAAPAADERSASNQPVAPVVPPSNGPSPDNPVGIKF